MTNRLQAGWVGRVAFVLFVLAAAPAAAATLKVSSFPSGAQVIIDGVNTGKVTPMSVSVTEGDHVVSVLIPNSGWNPDTRTVTINPGNNDLSVTLLPLLMTGPQGPEGPQGPQGIQGVQGEPGRDGATGPLFRGSVGLDATQTILSFPGLGNANVKAVCNADATSVVIRLENPGDPFLFANVIVNGGSTRDFAGPGGTSSGVTLSDGAAGLWRLTTNFSNPGPQVLVFISNAQVQPGPACFVEAQAIQSQ